MRKLAKQHYTGGERVACLNSSRLDEPSVLDELAHDCCVDLDEIHDQTAAMLGAYAKRSSICEF